MAGIFRTHDALRRHDRQPAYSLAESFHENTKLRRLGPVTALDSVEYPTRELDAMARAYKRYRLHPQVSLPAIQGEYDRTEFGDLIAARRSGRAFSPDTLTLVEVSALMRWSYGITGHLTIPGGGIQHVRAAPSAGALYPAEIYLGVRAVDGLAPGLYHFEVPENSLAVLGRDDPTSNLERACCGQPYVRAAALVVVIAAVFERTTRKYGDRGYRYVFLDVGHLAQNLCLACAALGLSVVTTCGFYDDELADVLGVDGCEEAPLYVACVGRPSAGESCDQRPST